MIPAAIASFALLLAVAYLIARPFVAPVAYDRTVTLGQLCADRERLRAQLRELEMDFETGKLAQDEYEKLRARRLQQIEGVTRAIRQTEPTEGAAIAAAEAGSSQAATGDLDEELERRIEERRHVLEEAQELACPGCGNATDPDDRFCRRCGADLATTAETR
jgi:rubrerythrin